MYSGKSKIYQMPSIKTIKLEMPEHSPHPDQLAAIIGRLRELVCETGHIAGNLPFGQEISLAAGKVNARLDAIARAPLPDLQICLFGEFSCGRTSFAHALTGLEPDALAKAYPGIPLKICHSDKEEIFLTLTNGQKIALPWSKPENEPDPEEIGEIVWQSPRMEAGFCLVDPPGLGSLVSKHDEVARKIAKESDIILVLSNLAASPLSSKLLREVASIAPNKARNCVFIGKFADKFASADLQKLDNYFAKKLAASFDHAPPHFFVSTYSGQGNAETASNSEAGANFAAFRPQLAQYLREARANKGLARDCAEIEKTMAEFMPFLDRFLQKFRKACPKNNSLQAAKPRAKADLLANFEKACANTRKTCEIAVIKKLDGFRLAIISRVNAFQNVDGLIKYLGPELDRDFANFDRAFQDCLQACLIRPMLKIAAECAQAAGHSGNPLPQSSAKTCDVAIINFRPESMQDLENSYATHKKSKLGGGLGAGLAAALFVPGAGWLAGGLMAVGGFFLGSLFAPGIGDLKKDCLKKLAHTFDKLHNDAMLAVSINYEKIRAAILDDLGKLRDAQDLEKIGGKDCREAIEALAHRLRLLECLLGNLEKIKQSNKTII